MDEREEPIFRDTLFHRKRKKGRWDVVDAPALPDVPIADTHAHLQLLPDPALSLARAGFYRLGFIELITDIAEDGTVLFDHLDEWTQQAEDVLRELADGEGDDDRGEGEGEGDEGDDGDARGEGEGEGGEGDGGDARDEGEGDGGDARDGTRADDADTADAHTDDARTADARDDDHPRLPHTRIACGVHPHNARLYDDEMEAHLKSLLNDERTSAIGEVGLDYHYDYSPRDVQRDVFRRQVQLAHELDVPIILHMREAHDDGFAILEEEGFPAAGTLLHCFNLDTTELERWVDSGCFVAFGGPLTFKKSDYVREAATHVPFDRLLTETDAPFMTPEPLRGTTCGPEHVVWTAEKLCEVRGATTDDERADLLAQLYENAVGLLDRDSRNG